MFIPLNFVLLFLNVTFFYDIFSVDFIKSIYNLYYCSFVFVLEWMFNSFFFVCLILSEENVALPNGLLVELSVKQSFQERKSIPFLLCRELAKRLTEPLPLSNHNLELTVAQSLLQSLPEGTWSVLPFLLPASPKIWWRLLMLPGSCLAKDTLTAYTMPPNTHTSCPAVQRFLWCPNPYPVILRSSWIKADYHTACTGLHLTSALRNPFYQIMFSWEAIDLYWGAF